MANSAHPTRVSWSLCGAVRRWSRRVPAGGGRSRKRAWSAREDDKLRAAMAAAGSATRSHPKVRVRQAGDPPIHPSINPSCSIGTERDPVDCLGHRAHAAVARPDLQKVRFGPPRLSLQVSYEQIARAVPGRSSQECRERWMVLVPREKPEGSPEVGSPHKKSDARTPRSAKEADAGARRSGGKSPPLHCHAG